MLWFVPIASTQININSISGETNVFNVQEALGANANYFTIKNYMDSLVQNGIINDPLEDGAASKFSRWDWFGMEELLIHQIRPTMESFSTFLFYV